MADQVIFICGHYEGVDQRVEDTYATDVLSIGDYVLTGGEMPAMIMADSIIRLLPGVLGDDASSEEESFQDGLLEYPQYTRPPVFSRSGGAQVLLSAIMRYPPLAAGGSLCAEPICGGRTFIQGDAEPEDVTVWAEIKKMP